MPKKSLFGLIESESPKKAAWPGLKSVLEFFTMFGFMDTFAKIMLFLLNWFYGNIIANYGFAIIFLTIVVRSAMFPLTLKGMKSMKKIWDMLITQILLLKQQNLVYQKSQTGAI